MRVTWSEAARRDLRAIQEFISNTSEHYAAIVVERILSAVDRIEFFPESGRVVPELNDANVREVIDGPYRIVYELRSGQAEVLTVFRATRQFPMQGDSHASFRAPAS